LVFRLWDQIVEEGWRPQPDEEVKAEFAPSDCRLPSGSVSSLDLGTSGIPYSAASLTTSPVTGGTPPVTATHHEYRGYVFTLTYQAHDPAYTVNFPDFPEIITSGATLAAAFANAYEALDLHLESMQKLGSGCPSLNTPW